MNKQKNLASNSILFIQDQKVHPSQISRLILYSMHSMRLYMLFERTQSDLVYINANTCKCTFWAPCLSQTKCVPECFSICQCKYTYHTVNNCGQANFGSVLRALGIPPKNFSKSKIKFKIFRIFSGDI